MGKVSTMGVNTVVNKIIDNFKLYWCILTTHLSSVDADSHLLKLVELWVEIRGI